MTDIEFFEHINKGWQEAHQNPYDTKEYHIRRGMGKPISGLVEDLFGVFLASNLRRKDQRFYIDKVVSYNKKGVKKAIFFKPDVLILNNQNIVTHYFDLKTNLGRLRKADDYLKEKNDFMSYLRTIKAWITWDGEPKMPIKFSSGLKYYMVIVFGWGITIKEMKKNIAAANTLPNVELYQLESKPKKGSPRIINHDEFKRLLNDAKNALIP